jgi:hypothetical protein
MPFRNYHQFDAVIVQLMTEAYDAALLQLGITGNDPMSGEVAAQIAMLADGGERVPDVLCRTALDRLKLNSQLASPTMRGRDIRE